MNWEDPSRAWHGFLTQIEQAKYELGCSFHNAWFRGHSDSGFSLLPSLFRPRKFPAAPSRTLARQIEQCRVKVDALAEEIARERASHNKERLAGGTTDLLRARLSEKKNERKQARKQLDDLRAKQLLFLGEHEAFVEYSYRSGTSENSWKVLAEMQHHGVPTRLLDWTEVLAIAVHFAVSRYREVLQDSWRHELTRNDHRRIFEDPKIRSTPSIWILNPFKLSDLATGHRRIWDVTLDQTMDYADCFLGHKEWRYEKPIPVVSPWVNPRIAAQQGMFTVAGKSREPIEVQCAGVVRKVDLEPLAAIYAVKHLIEFAGITNYTLFRDQDSLGRRVGEEYLGL